MLDRTSGLTRIFRRAGEGPSHSVLGMRHDYKLLASESAGQFMAFIINVPVGCGAPMHAHDRDTESFFVLEGEITAIAQDGTRTVAGPGDFIWFGRGEVHAFCNQGTREARAFVVQSPGTEGEQFFFDMADAEKSADFAPERDVAPIARRNGISIFAPDPDRIPA